VIQATPAGRLLTVFDAVREVGQELSFRKLWSAALAHQIGSSEEVANFAELGMLLRRIDIVAQGVARSGSGYDADALLHNYTKWSQVVFGWGIDTAENHRYRGTALISNDTRNTLASTHNLLSAASREGLFPQNSRDQLLDHASHLVGSLIEDIGSDQELPEVARIRLIERLVDLRETLRMVHFRGDEAVVMALQRAEIEFRSTTGPVGAARIPVQQRLIGWSETLAQLSQNAAAALSVPGAVTYYLATKDVEGATLILGGGGPKVVNSAVDKFLQARTPKEIERGVSGAPDELPNEEDPATEG
jgi:hypothetical protein